jgi:Secretion system C-terminal sorting domain
MKPLSAIVKKLLCATLKIGIPLFSFFNGNSQTNISGIVNTYHQVVEIIPAKACLRITNIGALNLNSRVMLVQMKGATMDISNSSTFGDITALNEAGNYEIGTVCYIKDDSVFLFHELLNTYNTSSGKVQLVQFAEYLSANVIDTVKAAPWDSTAGTGGVIALFTSTSLTLNAPVYADSSGYSGGEYLHHSGTCPLVGTGFVYDASATGTANGAYKGESVCNISGLQDGGKGAPANGGGGGNNHNNSGAGGANLSSGGNGGGNSSSGPIGCNIPNNYGRAGKALSSLGGQKIFFGGGAGAGHSNNGSATTNYGGNGGGIIFIWAETIIGNGHKITASGGDGGTSAGDGAGGGGAGGTIILQATNYSGSILVEAAGGEGGLSNDGSTAGRCFGGGGGGSGGAIYFSTALPAVTTTINGGAGGAEINRSGTCNAAVAGADGSNGSIFSNYSFTRSSITANYCQVLLPIKLVSFSAALSNKKALLYWQVQNPELVKHYILEKSINGFQWNSWKLIAGQPGLTDYTATDETLLAEKIFYRLKIVQHNNEISYSPVRLVTNKNKSFFVYPNPAKENISLVANSGGSQVVTLINMEGKRVLSQKVNPGVNNMAIGHLPGGIYLLRCNGETEKIIIR